MLPTRQHGTAKPGYWAFWVAKPKPWQPSTAPWPSTPNTSRHSGANGGWKHYNCSCFVSVVRISSKRAERESNETLRAGCAGCRWDANDHKKRRASTQERRRLAMAAGTFAEAARTGTRRGEDRHCHQPGRGSFRLSAAAGPARRTGTYVARGQSPPGRALRVLYASESDTPAVPGSRE